MEILARIRFAQFPNKHRILLILNTKMLLQDYLEACGLQATWRQSYREAFFRPQGLMWQTMNADETRTVLDLLMQDFETSKTWLMGMLNRSEVQFVHLFYLENQGQLCLWTYNSMECKSTTALDYIQKLRRRRVVGFAVLARSLPEELAKLIIWNY